MTADEAVAGSAAAAAAGAGPELPVSRALPVLRTPRLPSPPGPWPVLPSIDPRPVIRLWPVPPPASRVPVRGPLSPPPLPARVARTVARRDRGRSRQPLLVRAWSRRSYHGCCRWAARPVADAAAVALDGAALVQSLKSRRNLLLLLLVLDLLANFFVRPFRHSRA